MKDRDEPEQRWIFAESPDTGVYTTNRVMNGEDDVTRVFHDSEDGAWQFHGPGESKPEDAIYVCLRCIISSDRSIEALADLPTGWCAWRENKTSPWTRDLQEDENAGTREG